VQAPVCAVPVLTAARFLPLFAPHNNPLPDPHLDLTYQAKKGIIPIKAIIEEDEEGGTAP
jgi:hypothetical protein